MKKLRLLAIVTVLMFAFSFSAFAAVSVTPVAATTAEQDWQIEKEALIDAQKAYLNKLVAAGKITQTTADARLKAYSESLTQEPKQVQPAPKTDDYGFGRGFCYQNGNGSANQRGCGRYR